MCKVSGKSKYRLDSGSVSFTDDRNVFGIGCTRLYQVAPGSTRKHQAVPGPWRGLSTIFTWARQGWSSNSSLYLSIISISKSINTLLTFLPRVSFSESSSPSSFYLKPSLNPNAAVSITIVARSRAHCRNLRSAVIIAPFFKSVGGLPIGGYWQTVYIFWERSANNLLLADHNSLPINTSNS